MDITAVDQWFSDRGTKTIAFTKEHVFRFIAEFGPQCYTEERWHQVLRLANGLNNDLHYPIDGLTALPLILRLAELAGVTQKSGTEVIQQVIDDALDFFENNPGIVRDLLRSFE